MVKGSALDKLKHLYYNELNFFGRDKLYKLAKSRGINLTRRKIAEWLKQQEVSQFYYNKQVKRPKVVRPTITHCPFQQLGMDLADAQAFADTSLGIKKQYNYIFVMIDFFSKFVYAEPMQGKEDTEALRAFKTSGRRLALA